MLGGLRSLWRVLRSRRSFEAGMSEELRFHVHAAVGDDLPVSFARNLSKFGPYHRIADDAQERHKDLVKPRFKRLVDQGIGHSFLSMVSKTKQQELVAEMEGFFSVRGR